MGFIGYRRQQESSGDNAVRIYMECREDESPGGSARAANCFCGYVVDVIFSPNDGPCRLRGVDGVLALKKFYKLVFSLEERAREHGNDWAVVMTSPERLLEHLAYTRNARDFTGLPEPKRTPRLDEPSGAACPSAMKGN